VTRFQFSDQPAQAPDFRNSRGPMGPPARALVRLGFRCDPPLQYIQEIFEFANRRPRALKPLFDFRGISMSSIVVGLAIFPVVHCGSSCRAGSGSIRTIAQCHSERNGGAEAVI
jgi:hypothetical protein